MKAQSQLTISVLLILSASFLAFALVFTLNTGNRTSPGQILVVSVVYSLCIGVGVGISFRLFLAQVLKRGIGLKLLFIAATIAVCATAGVLLGSLILVAAGVVGAERYLEFTLKNWQLSALITTVAVIVSYLTRSMWARLADAELEIRARQLAEANARGLAMEAKLSSLESRVRPHFLFNTLNSISALIREQPALAERMIEQLAMLLRFSLDAMEAKEIALADEIRVVRGYLEIEKQRFGDRLNFYLEVDGRSLNAQIPPFSIQTLVENSIKHVISGKRSPSHISVKCKTEIHSLRIEVCDDGDGFKEDAVLPGHGLHNLRARIDSLYGSSGGLTIERRCERTVVSVIIPLRTN